MKCEQAGLRLKFDELQSEFAYRTPYQHIEYQTYLLRVSSPFTPPIFSGSHNSSKKMSKMLLSSSLRVVRSGTARQFSSAEQLAKTSFYDMHNELGGKMVSFAGYSLPVQVKELQKRLKCARILCPQPI